MQDLTAVVPLRSPGRGKTRLSPALDREARAALAGAMLADVLDALREAGLEVVVAAGGQAAAAAASALRADVVMDAPGTRSLDDAVEQARRRVAPTTGLLVVQADLPALTTADVTALVEGDAPVVIAPTADGGTSALLRRPSSIMGTAFGAGSGAAHERLARAAGVVPRIVRRDGLRHDVDVVDDLRDLAGRAMGPATTTVLAGLGFGRDASDCA